MERIPTSEGQSVAQAACVPVAAPRNTTDTDPMAQQMRLRHVQGVTRRLREENTMLVVMLFGVSVGNMAALGKDLVSAFTNFTGRPSLSVELSYGVTLTEEYIRNPELAAIRSYANVSIDGTDFVIRTYQRTNESDFLLTDFDHFKPDRIAILEKGQYWSIRRRNGAISTWQVGEGRKPTAKPEFTLYAALYSNRSGLSYIRSLGLSGEIVPLDFPIIWHGLSFHASGPSNKISGILQLSNGIPALALVTNRLIGKPISYLSKVEYFYDPEISQELPTRFDDYGRQGTSWVHRRAVQIRLLSWGVKKPISAAETIEGLRNSGYFSGTNVTVYTYTGDEIVYTNEVGQVGWVAVHSPPRGLRALLATLFQKRMSLLFIFVCLLSFPIVFFALRKAKGQSK
jgi:hypothetical protein